MLKIDNFNKIQKRWFVDWQIGRTDEGKGYYALNAKHKDGKRSVTVVIFKEDKLDTEFAETAYSISLIDDAVGISSQIDDIIYKAVLEDMELFGESLVHYLNTI
jgi:hypothetical protein